MAVVVVGYGREEWLKMIFYGNYLVQWEGNVLMFNFFIMFYDLRFSLRGEFHKNESF